MLVHLLAAEQPGGPGHEVVAAAGEVGDLLGVLDQPALGFVAVAAVGAALLQPRERLARRGVLLDLGEQVVDRRVAAGGDADAVALLDQVQDQMGAGVGLARAGRALDEQVAVAQALRDPLRVLQVERARLQGLAT